MPRPISNPTARQGLQIGDRLMVQCEDQLFYKALITRVNDASLTILFDSDGQQAEISHQATADPIRGICALDKREALLTGVSGEEADMLLQSEPAGQAEIRGLAGAAPRQRKPRRTRAQIEADSAAASLEHKRPSGIVDGMGGILKGYRNKLAALLTLTHDDMLVVFKKASLDDLTAAQSAIYDEFHEMRQLEEAFPDKLPSIYPEQYDICRREIGEVQPGDTVDIPQGKLIADIRAETKEEAAT